jgi:hypothetical protein
MAETKLATEGEVSDFLARLAEFHATLDDTGKSLLDELTINALTPPEVDGFMMPGSMGMMQTSMMAQGPNQAGQYYYYYGPVASQLNPSPTMNPGINPGINPGTSRGY